MGRRERFLSGRDEAMKTEYASRNDYVPYGLFRKLLYCYEAGSWGVWWLVVVVVLFRGLTQLHPLFELASHFTWHAMVLAAIGLVIALLRYGISKRDPERRTRSYDQLTKVITFGIGLMVLIPVVRPWALMAKPLPVSQAKTIKVLSWNIWLDNWSALEAMRVIRESQADIVALYELNPQLAQRINDIRQDYVVEKWSPEWNPGSIVALSRLEGVQFRVWDPADVGMPAIEITLPAGTLSRETRLLALHTKSPTPFHPSRTRLRDRQLEAIAGWGREQSGPFAIMGDLNITPWSPAFERTLKACQAADSRLGHGNQASWPSFLGPMGIPIDHCLVGGGFEVVSRKVLRGDFGSDHAPVLLELRLQE